MRWQVTLVHYGFDTSGLKFGLLLSRSVVGWWLCGCTLKLGVVIRGRIVSATRRHAKFMRFAFHPSCGSGCRSG